MKKRSTLEMMVRTSRHLSAEELLTVVYQQTPNSPYMVDLAIEKEALDELAVKSKEPLVELSMPTEQPTQYGRLHYEVHTFWLLWKLQFLIRGKQMVRSDVVKFLTTLLNAQITAASNEGLAPLFFGMGKCCKFFKEDPYADWQCKELLITEAVPSYTEFPGLCKSQYMLIRDGLDLAQVALRSLQMQPLIDKYDATIALIWETCGGWADLLKPVFQETGSKSSSVQMVSERLQCLTEGSKQVAKKNTKPGLNQILARFSQEQAQLHEAAKKLRKDLTTMIIQDLQPSLSDKKVSEFSSKMGPSISDIQVSLFALTFALSKANSRIQAIFKNAFNSELDGQPKSDSFEQQFDALEYGLNKILEKILEIQNPFQKFKIQARVEQEGQKAEEKKEEKPEEKKEETKEDKKGGKKGKKGEKYIEKLKEIPFGKGTSQLIDYLGKKVIQDERYENAPLKIIEEKTNPAICKEFKELLNEVLSQHNQERRRPKIPKGSRDMDPFQMRIKQMALKQIRDVFEAHGAVEIDTPVFELKETLTGKYGQDSKLIYDLQDQGGELLSLRYDLTVPFARYVASKNVMAIKRFHIAKVYRRDNPQIARGRFREFYQCDFDIAGAYSGVMLPDVEVLRVIVDILKALDLGKFVVKLNHRKFLDAIIQLSGCDVKNFNNICSSIDKLDKEPWEKVAKELIQTKGVSQEAVENLYKFVQLRGSVQELLAKLREEQILKGHAGGEKALEEMQTLANYMSQLGLQSYFSLDFSLARGLDYYTGVIFEAVLVGGHVGSIAGGGRYDGLIGQFMGKKQIPSVGGSIGIERIFAILEEKAKHDKLVRASPTQVLVCSVGKNMTPHRLKLCDNLWKAGFRAQFLYVDNPKPANQLSYALENRIPVMIWIGEDEISKGVVKVKTTATKEQVEMEEGDLMKNLQEIYQKVKNMAIEKQES